tara:strand:+ start:433 stop:756 length:324 start_codon:yes stop_codon:yes gene_type:complete
MDLNSPNNKGLHFSFNCERLVMKNLKNILIVGLFGVLICLGGCSVGGAGAELSGKLKLGADRVETIGSTIKSNKTTSADGDTTSEFTLGGIPNSDQFREEGTRNPLR